MSSKTEPAVFTTKFKGSLAIYKENERKEHQFNITEITYASPQT
jgi:hypothetical protein